MADNFTTFKCRLSRNLGASTSWNPKGLSRPVMGLLYLYLYRRVQISCAVCISNPPGRRVRILKHGTRKNYFDSRSDRLTSRENAAGTHSRGVAWAPLRVGALRKNK